MEVSRHIQAGGEIFVSYGSDYWRGAHSTSHSTSYVPGWEWDCFDPFAQMSVARDPQPVHAPDRVYAVRPGSVRALAPADDGHDVASRLVYTMGHGPQHPVLGLSFSLSMLCCSRVAGFLGCLLNAASLNMSIPPVDAVIVHVVASPVVPFPPLAGRRPQSVSFWQSKMADVASSGSAC